jgi:multidrug efflux pump subunit AcrA (membrane-fusion protein)
LSALEVEESIFELRAEELREKRIRLAITKSRADFEVGVARRKLELEQARRQIESTFGSVRVVGPGLEVLSPTSGKVSFVVDEVGTLIPAGRRLVRIEQEGQDVVAAGRVGPDLVGRVRGASHVHIRLATFPSEHWGTLDGRIESLSRLPDEGGHYPIVISIDDEGLLAGRLHGGMTGDALIRLRDERLLSMLFSEVKELFQEDELAP